MRKQPDPNRPRRWQAILRRLPTDRALIGAEIGVWMGRSAKELLAERSLLTHLMVDPWRAPDPQSSYAQSADRIAKQRQPYFDDCFRQTLAAVAPFGERAVIMRCTSQQLAPLIRDASLDFAFIDAEHTEEGVRRDVALWLPKVKPGGWIGGHDYANLPRFPGVQRAVDEAFPEGLDLDGDCTWFWRLPCES